MKSQTFKTYDLPDKPGVYLFLAHPKLYAKEGFSSNILYIGKATSLKDRVRSYFGKDLIDTRGPLLVDMVFKAENIEWIETPSVLEALILEANLIKKHQPYYNTKEKSDKSFNYVCITKPARNASHSDAGGDELPKVLVLRGKNLDKSDYKKVFGPYTNGGQLREALKIIRKIFPFYDDKTKNYKEFYKQIKLVPSEENKKEYLRNIKHIILFLNGKKKDIIIDLNREMKIHAKKLEFEKAGEIKRKIFALNHINDIALIKGDDKYENQNFGNALRRSHSILNPQDLSGGSEYSSKHIQNFSFRIEAYDIAHMSGQNMVGVMTVIEDGEVAKNEYKKFKIRTQSDANDTGALREVLERRLKHTEWTLPSFIVVDGSTAQINTAEKVLRENNLDIKVVAVTKDNRHKVAKLTLSPRSNLKGVQGSTFINKYKREIILVNNEAHRFAITYHKQMRGKNFLK
ncbi:MAG: UvrB/UvrC motif-containing protein [Candidatus Paceibacterota bacterium]